MGDLYGVLQADIGGTEIAKGAVLHVVAAHG